MVNNTSKTVFHATMTTFYNKVNVSVGLVLAVGYLLYSTDGGSVVGVVALAVGGQYFREINTRKCVGYVCVWCAE